jgi:AcrR family transcriptional regulator
MSSVDDDVRPMRADARRNRDKIVQAAQEVFAERGAEGSLDEVARRAGVGPGTLYRHFPTREDLIDALMCDWATRVVADSQAAVEDELPARETLTRWFAAMVAHLTLHRGAAARLSAAMDDASSPIHGKCQLMSEANERVVARVAERGALRPDIEPRRVMRLLTGVATVADTADLPPEEIASMLDVLVDGILADPS